MRTALGLTAIAATLALSLGTLDAQAQTYPTRSIKIVVPATPGGAIDVIARLLGDKLTAAMGQPVVIENKPGASNNLGTDFVAKSTPDGYTLVICASSRPATASAGPQVPMRRADFKTSVLIQIAAAQYDILASGPHIDAAACGPRP
jgi:tripartite-type tricarboxylate transporter receptor subunit TctC